MQATRVPRNGSPHGPGSSACPTDLQLIDLACLLPSLHYQWQRVSCLRAARLVFLGTAAGEVQQGVLHVYVCNALSSVQELLET